MKPFNHAGDRKKITALFIALWMILGAAAAPGVYAAETGGQGQGEANAQAQVQKQETVKAESRPWESELQNQEAKEPETPLEPVKTTVSGLKTELLKPVSSNITDAITVSPAKGRVIALQLYDRTAKKWVTKETFETGSKDKEKLVIAYPEDWKKSNATVWRLTMKEGKGGTAYTSSKIRIMARNRETLKLSAKSAIIMEKESGQIFYGKSMDTRRANASTTKIMTTILALENRKWDSRVTISQNVIKTPYTTLRYSKGDEIRMKDLIYAALVLSDNGSATALAEHTSGSVEAFAERMNQKALSLGCPDTNFVNPHGLDAKNHYSTARDLAVIAGYAMNNDKFSQAVKTKKYGFTSLKKKKYYSFKSTDKLLGEVSGVVGIKTGTTGNAGCCFVGDFRYKGKDYITVVLGAKKDAQRWEDTRALIRYIKKYV